MGACSTYYLSNSTQMVRISFADEPVTELATPDPQIVLEMTKNSESAESIHKEVSYSYC